MTNIIITDKNPGIRILISREISDLDVNTVIAESISAVLEIDQKNTKTVIILDPEILQGKHLIFTNKILGNFPKSVILIHGYFEWAEIFLENKKIFFIEKNAESIKYVKSFITSHLKL
jgi:DNA-binding NtrC family response regulator